MSLEDTRMVGNVKVVMLKSMSTPIINAEVDKWLDEHPEATTTVLDGSLTEPKFSDALKLKTIKDYVTPEMYGAIGDGTTDDTDAIQSAIDSGQVVVLINHYLITDTISIGNNCKIYGLNGKIEIDDSIAILKAFQIATNSENIIIDGVEFVGHCDSSTDDESGLVAIESLNNNSNIIISNCVFSGFNKNIEMTENINCNIYNNIILNATETLNKLNGYGILLESCNNVTIQNNKIYGIERHCVYLNESEYVNIISNQLNGQTDDLSRYAHSEGNIKLCGCKQIIIDSNTIKGNYYGIALAKSFVTENFGNENVIISNNIIRDMISVTGHAWGGVGIVENNCTYKNIKIANNEIINDSSTNGIFIDTGTVDNIEISDNFCKGFDRGIRIGVLGCIALNNNLCVDCTLGYNLAGNIEFTISGTNNFCKNCTDRCNTIQSVVYTRKCKLSPFLDTDNRNGTELTSKILPMIDNMFYANPSGVTTITEIVGGTYNEIINIFCSANGSLILKESNVNGLKLKEDFSPTSQGIITLVQRNGTWYEQSRTLFPN